VSTPLLEVRSLFKRFGALPVTDGVSLQVMSGEVHALIGPNGAGKSTLVAQICGELRSDSGEILLAGERIGHLPPHRRALAGLARAYQVPSLFGSLTAKNNATVPVLARLGRGFHFWGKAEQDREMADAAATAVERVRLGPSQRLAEQLAHGHKRQLELAMCLASQPTLMLLDEPLAGLGGADAQDMIALLKSLKGAEFSMLLVEHDMEAVFALADRISVLVAGRIIACGTPDAIRADAAVRAAYLGEEVVP
jgi:branched-chain amino acid transport system ATP-binding protein